MIELVIREYLISKLEIPVVFEYQKNLPEQFISNSELWCIFI